MTTEEYMETKKESTCPHCGYCPHCGRSNQYTYPYYWPYYPHTGSPWVWPSTPIVVSSGTGEPTGVTTSNSTANVPFTYTNQS